MELGAKKLPHVYILQNMTHSPIQDPSQSCCQVMTLTIMIVTMKIKLVVEFWSFVDDVSGIRSQKATECVHFTEHDTLTDTGNISIMSPVEDTQNCDCYHENKVICRVWSLVDDSSGIGNCMCTFQ